MTAATRIHLVVNGRSVAVDVRRSDTALDALRDHLGLTGVKNGCAQGDCGCCTILLDGTPTKACLTSARRLSGRTVTTIEGLAPADAPHPLQHAFVEIGAVQCGYCAPAQILTAKALLDKNPAPTRAEVTEALAGVLCRCTGYVKIIDAVLLAAARLRGDDAAAALPLTPSHLRVVGQPLALRGGMDKAQGRTLYAGDRRRDGMVFAQVVRSPHHSARIVAIDTSAARRVAGVLDVITADDVPRNRLCLFDKSFIDPDTVIHLPRLPSLFGVAVGGITIPGTFTKDQPALAQGRVRHVGEPVAVVAAETRAAARDAARRVQVSYETTAAVLDGLSALAPDAPRVHERGNLLFARRIVQGAVARGFEEADVIVEGVYTTSPVEHAYLEPDAALAYLDDEGRVVVEASCMHPHYIHDEIAHVLDIPTEAVRVIQTPTGGSFGGKHDVAAQVAAALLTYRLRRPVQLVFSRRDVMEGTPKRHAFRMWYRTGARGDGTLTAMHAQLLIEAGAYATWSPGVLTRASVEAPGPYRCPNVLIEGAAVYTNHPPAGAMRGFGAPQVTFARESQLDRLAERLGLDPLELRMRNAYRGGDVMPTEQVLGPTVEMQDTLRGVDAAYRSMQARAAEANAAEKGPWRHGVGVASMWFGLGKTGRSNLAEAFVEMGKDNRVHVYSGAAEVGQGTATVLAQIAAEELGVPYEDVDITVGDTLLTPNADFTCASRQTHISGNAVRFAARDLREVLRQGAARLLDVTPERVRQENRNLLDPASGKSLSLAEVADFCRGEGLPLRHKGAYDIVTAAIDIETGRGQAYPFFAYGTQAALVRVNTETGAVRVLRVAAAHDFGLVVNPLSVTGQMEGSIGMGIGYALSEEFRSGKSRRLRDCKLPTSRDMPEIEIAMVETPEPTGPFGAKGAGESTMLPVAPAILNAVARATGARVFDLPAHPDRVLAALRATAHLQDDVAVKAPPATSTSGSIQ